MLARPHSHCAILAALNKISIFYPDALDDGMRCVVVLIYANTRPTAPVATVSLVIHFHYILARCGDDAACVKHHAGDGVVVGVGIVDRASPEIPDLHNVSV